ncbi:hypothetical protein KIPB_015736 [Kipferlia bialata]|uniref:Uncharacterized protein n=1 Tax=Kipferlia bialata TaxID=797122 RepID=A0A9K3DAF3_9EUKA|nr:hypothetical protein KIPB_015736 [Kipferlia bialata]|eukprot:g15736.t1
MLSADPSGVYLSALRGADAAEVTNLCAVLCQVLARIDDWKTHNTEAGIERDVLTHLMARLPSMLTLLRCMEDAPPVEC